MDKKTFKIGFIGMGTVAQGVWKHLENNRGQMTARLGANYELAKASVPRHLEKARGGHTALEADGKSLRHRQRPLH